LPDDDEFVADVAFKFSILALVTEGTAPAPIVKVRDAPDEGASELDEFADVPSVAFKLTLLPKLVELPKLSCDLVPP
jgi:hypothetical protein